MNRIDRISAILIQLQSRKIVRAQDIAGRFKISLRTVYRDIRSLEEAGIPLIGEAGVGYSLVDGFRLPPVMFTHDEAIAFLTAEKLVDQLTDGPNALNYCSAMYKIRSVLNPREKELLESIDDHIQVFRRPGDTGIHPDLNLMQPILKSIDRRFVLSVQYHSRYKQERTDRELEPLGIFHIDNNWHLIAWCRIRKDYRDFRLDRIASAALTDIPYSQSHPSLKEYLLQKRNSLDSRADKLKLVVISINQSKAFWLDHQKYYNGFISQSGIDQVEMTFLTSSLESFARWYLMFGDYATIIKPEALKDRVRAMISNISEKLE